jgi:hypothetical protein
MDMGIVSADRRYDFRGFSAGAKYRDFRMNYRIYRAPDFQVQPWKNGQGSTTQLWILPGDDGEFLLRLSIAAVKQSGPFSRFSGYDRTIIQLTGGPMTLRHDGGEQHVLLPLTPHAFSGDARTDCTLPDVAEDYNVMSRRRRVQAVTTVAVLANGAVADIPAGMSDFLLYVQHGSVVMGAGAAGVCVAGGELLSCTLPDTASAVRAVDPDTCVIVTGWRLLSAAGAAGDRQA